MIKCARFLLEQSNEAAPDPVRQRCEVQRAGLRYSLVRDIAADSGRSFGAHIRDVVREDPRRAACESWGHLVVTDAARATIATLERGVPAAPGILVAATNTFLSPPTDAALEFRAPTVERLPICGRQVALDLTRSRGPLGFETNVLRDDIAPEQLVDLESEPAHV